MTFYNVAYSGSEFGGTFLACFLKRRGDEGNPVFLGNFVHEDDLAETIKRTIGIVDFVANVPNWNGDFAIFVMRRYLYVANTSANIQKVTQR